MKTQKPSQETPTSTNSVARLVCQASSGESAVRLRHLAKFLQEVPNRINLRSNTNNKLKVEKQTQKLEEKLSTSVAIFF